MFTWNKTMNVHEVPIVFRPSLLGETVVHYVNSLRSRDVTIRHDVIILWKCIRNIKCTITVHYLDSPCVRQYHVSGYMAGNTMCIFMQLTSAILQLITKMSTKTATVIMQSHALCNAYDNKCVWFIWQTWYFFDSDDMVLVAKIIMKLIVISTTPYQSEHNVRPDTRPLQLSLIYQFRDICLVFEQFSFWDTIS